MKLPSRDELNHWWNVARVFPTFSHEWWLGLFHDTVEDGYLPEALLEMWPALKSITRSPLETYSEYVVRLAKDPVAKRVKLSDLHHNLSRPLKSHYLTKRHKKAMAYLLSLGEDDE